MPGLKATYRVSMTVAIVTLGRDSKLVRAPKDPRPVRSTIA